MREVQRCSSKMESVSKKRRVGVVGTGALKAADYELVPHHRSMIPLVLLASASEAFTIGRTPHAARATTRSSFITSKVVDVRSHEEFEAAINADNLVVVEFGMSWCAPCKKSAPELQRLSEEFPDISVYQVMGDWNPDVMKLLKSFRIRSMPTFQLWKDSAQVETVKGAKFSQLFSAVAAHSRQHFV